MRRLLTSILLCLATTVAIAQDANKASADDAKQFIDKTVVYFPKQLGNYRLTGQEYDPQQVGAGVSLEYVADGAPAGTYLTLYVYPMGRVAPADALASGEADIINGVTEAQKQGLYSDLVIGSKLDFEVDAPTWSITDNTAGGSTSEDAPATPPEAAAPAKAGDAPAAASTSDALPDKILEAIGQLDPPKKTAGRKVLLSFTAHGSARHSVGYVFFRNLYLIKIRMTLPAEGHALSEVEALGDATARQLVPAIRIANYGTCGNIELNVPESAKDDDASVAAEMLKGFARVKQESCASSESGSEPVDASLATQTIVYPEGTWK